MPDQHAVIQTEVYTGKNHKNRANPFGADAAVRTDTRIARAEAAGSDGRKAVAERIEKIHAGAHKQYGLNKRQCNIDEPQNFRRYRNFRRDFSLFGAGRFCLYKLKAPDTQNRQKRDG